MNKAEAILHLYPGASPITDFKVFGVEGDQVIAEWNIRDDAGELVPEPTEAELATAWLEFRKQQKINDLNNQCEAAILGGFTAANTHRYGFSQYDQLNFTQQLALMNTDPAIASIDWKTEDAGVLTHTREEFVALVREAEAHKRGKIVQYWTLKAQVQAAATEAEVDAVTW